MDPFHNAVHTEKSADIRKQLAMVERFDVISSGIAGEIVLDWRA